MVHSKSLEKGTLHVLLSAISHEGQIDYSYFQCDNLRCDCSFSGCVLSSYW